MKGSLAIKHRDDVGVTFRYKIYIKRAGGDFIQWGADGNECHPDVDTSEWVFGPDVCPANPTRSTWPPPIGIFGLSHADLLLSEWVEHDVLTVKCELEVRPHTENDLEDLRQEPCDDSEVKVPPSTIANEYLTFFEKGTGADVTFVVAGEHIRAHSHILSARSEVFERQLNGYMRESVTKEIRIDDYDAGTFKALLKFIYTDDLQCVRDAVSKATQCSAAQAADSRVAALENILAISHKYELTRLGLWSEQQLCECITIDGVCSVLCKAHLYGAKHLERVCLTFAKEKFAGVIASPMFSKLPTDWPAVMVKLSAFMAGVSETQTAVALETAAGALKRKREN
jgi:speckle-type POZ protein